MTHCPVNFNGRGRKDGRVVEVQHDIPQFPLDLLVIHPLAGWGNICSKARTLSQILHYVTNWRENVVKQSFIATLGKEQSL